MRAASGGARTAHAARAAASSTVSVRCSAAASLAGLLLLAGCGGGGDSRETTTSTVGQRFPPFRALPVRAKVIPRRGGILTTFRIRFAPRGFVGVRSRAIEGYEARLFDRSNPNGAGCIIDTGGFLNTRGAQPEIVLDPRRQMGGRYCRGSFRGTLSYYRDFACPARGVCRPPKNFPRDRAAVSRLAFEVR